MTTEEERCPWAVRFRNLSTRCVLRAGHLDTATGPVPRHIGRGLSQFAYQRIEWFPGDQREFTTERTDEYAWEDEA